MNLELITSILVLITFLVVVGLITFGVIRYVKMGGSPFKAAWEWLKKVLDAMWGL